MELTKKIILLMFLGTIVSCKYETKTIEATDEKTNRNIVEDSLRNFASGQEQWITIKTNNQKKIAKIIGLESYEYRNWSSGLKDVHWDERMVYISPVVNNEWIFVVGYALPYPVSNKLKPLLKKLSIEFDEVNYYSNYSKPNYDIYSSCVVKFKKDTLIRFINYRESGEIEEIGKITIAEKEIGLKGKSLVVKYSSQLTNLNQSKPEVFKRKHPNLEYSSDVDGTIYVHSYIPWINDDFVYELAEKWDINPRNIDNGINYSTGLGLYGKLDFN